MPVRTKDYPLYTYDEPAVYKDFSGGINTDPSNEHLLKNEMRDCVNMTYLSGALVKRKGAKKLCDITCEDVLSFVQGIFLFTYKITYIILAADGKLYQGIYNDEATINLTRLPINKTKINRDYIFEEENVFDGLTEKSKEDREQNINHDGYISSVYRNLSDKSKPDIEKNPRGNYDSIGKDLEINVGDVFKYNSYLYVCIEKFYKTYETPADKNNWEEIEEFTYEDITITPEEYKNKTKEEQLALEEHKLFKFDINKTSLWRTDYYCYYEEKFYKCVRDHKNYLNIDNLTTEVINLSFINNSEYVEISNLVFQNYKPVEAATLNNKLYIATGTRIIEITLEHNELVAKPVSPYLCNYTEITKIGYNWLSPYPELAVASQKNTVTTSITGVKVKKTMGNSYILTPVMNIQIGDDVSNYYFRWEKFINGVWHVVVPFNSQDFSYETTEGETIFEKKDYSFLEVTDADKYSYRCTFAKSFANSKKIVGEWKRESNYTKGNLVSVGAHVYECLITHNSDEVSYLNGEFDLKAILIKESREVTLWKENFEYEILPYVYYEGDKAKYKYISDYAINKVDGEYFGSAVSVKFNNDLKINDKFELIHSCTKVLADGQKLLFYSDKYNSGQWFKTIINNPSYITDRGCLSFKTNKNESVIKVLPFQGNILVFANADNVGGSIHLVTGNGDDYDDQSGYYSPYQRHTINASISSTNADSIQICDNIIVFKYFNRVYYINASDLNNDTVKVTPCNDRVLNSEGEVKIPWDDDECISEVTNNYYALTWKEKYSIDEDGELILEHPGIRVKLYYKMGSQLPDGSYSMPWLRDESDIFNSNKIIYVKGKPLYLYHNTLITFDENYYLDLDNEYECKIHLKAVDLNYDSFLKLISHCLVSFHRNQFNNVTVNVIIKNEAGHVLLDSENYARHSNDIKAFIEGETYDKSSKVRIGSTIQDTKMFNTINKFPCLLADTYIKAKTKGSFTFSYVTFEYTSIDVPDMTPTEIYKNIIRMKEK